VTGLEEHSLQTDKNPDRHQPRQYAGTFDPIDEGVMDSVVFDPTYQSCSSLCFRDWSISDSAPSMIAAADERLQLSLAQKGTPQVAQNYRGMHLRRRRQRSINKALLIH